MANPRPLKIAIVGGGLGGLTAAISLRRQGHNIEVFESAATFTEIGAAIGLPPNAVRILDSLGCTNDRVQGVEYAGLASYDPDGNPGYTVTLGDIAGKYGCQWRLCHRVDAHEVLKNLAFGGGDGPPASLHLNSQVISCSPNEGTLTLKNGTTREFDLIIGADGIHSSVRASVLNETLEAPPSSVAAYRWVIDASKLDDHPELDWVLKRGPSGPRVVASRDFRVIFLYPCRNSTLVNAMGIHIDRRDQSKVGLHVPATRDELLDTFKDFDAKFQSFLNLAEDIGLWQFRSLPDLTTWVNGRVCLLGDAAHAMLPTIGQGAAMAFEDAATLAVLIPAGTAPEHISARLKAYQELRKQRADYIKTESLEQFIIPAKRGLYYRSTSELVCLYYGSGADSLNDRL
ncbi:FAD/NAD(P)-binding domain-containing protein [Leucogyrophana mollusca]|uniref:FAD/NAD(P)-binding domain-containing protein n=1 Tax=Leucogyrophana mollusca TaxID=85980 RepID=A0ACB8BIQ2_9AGAM|nr:FAD/NAD(P)-binding domain-containing protein [Leucogyrophana mollusca]